MKANKTCPICGKEFTSNDLRKRYCSTTCFKRSRSMQTIKCRADRNANKRMDWAYNEAEKLAEITITTGGEYISKLADYVYNNYNKRAKRKLNEVI